MAQVPSYDSPSSPQVLNPLNPHHYWTLVNWIFLKPSQLMQYLYRADSDLYFQSGWRPLLVALRCSAYRNLTAMMLELTLLLSVVVTWSPEADWGWAWSVVGVIALVAVGSVVGGVALGAALGIVLVVALSTAIVIVLTYMLSVRLLVVMFLMLPEWLDIGIALSVVMLLDMWSLHIVWREFWRFSGLRRLLAAALGVGVVRLLAVALATVLVGVSIPSVGWYLIFTLGSLAVLLVWREIWHFLNLERLLVATLEVGPGRLLATTLEEDFAIGLQIARRLLHNPLQRWIVARGFIKFLATASDPLGVFYCALSILLLDEYSVESTNETKSQPWSLAAALLLEELGGALVYADGERPSRTTERMAWTVTHSLRGEPHPRIWPLACFLFHLLDEETVAKQRATPILPEEVSAAVWSLPHGKEIALSLIALAQLAGIECLEEICEVWEEMDWLEQLSEPPLRPSVLEAMHGLRDVSIEVTRFRQASSLTTQATALNRCVGMLDELVRYVREIRLPERTLLALTVSCWRSLAVDAASRLGERALREMTPSARRALVSGERRAILWSRPAEPFFNPYKTGDPVYPPLFVGRGDIFHHIQEIWSSKANPDSIILYGHRRVGKSSILRNLDEYAPQGSLLVYADLKGVTAFTTSIHHLLQSLAEEVVWAAQGQCLNLPSPAPSDFVTSTDAALSFRRLLRQVLVTLPENGSLILALDEFEAVDVNVRAGKIGGEIYDYLRSLSQEPRIVLVFAGLHTLDEMSRNYQEAFFGSYVNIPVSYLSPQDAQRLIARPTPDFALNYHPDVIQHIIHETHGQPLLVQRICQELVNHLNHQLFDLEQEREARLLPEDLAAVLNDDFIRSETRYFDGIWTSQVRGRPAVETVIRSLAANPATLEALAQATDLVADMVAGALDYLKKRDLVTADEAGFWDLRVPLMRRWLQLLDH